ncbi:MAG: hypothetical protein HZA68_12975 [Rhodovulum sp.]|nr:hypothetical protein [Rhodovulum sp.]
MSDDRQPNSHKSTKIKPSAPAPATPEGTSLAADMADTAPIAAIVPGTAAEAIRARAGEFTRAVPEGAVRSGVHDLGDGVPIAAADGVYRVIGQDWLYRVAGGRLVEIRRADPPDFGGPDVIEVPTS